jgi:hypothetical protein
MLVKLNGFQQYILKWIILLKNWKINYLVLW